MHTQSRFQLYPITYLIVDLIAPETVTTTSTNHHSHYMQSLSPLIKPPQKLTLEQSMYTLVTLLECETFASHKVCHW